VRIVRRQGAVEEVRYRKGDDGRHYKHATEGPTDLLLVEVDGKRGALLLPRDNAHGWEKDGATYWLTNKPREKNTMAKKAHRRGTTRRKAHRPPPAGYKTWSAYMASIRPNTKRSAKRSGASMAKRKRRRKAGARRASPRQSYANNRPHRARRRYHRNPGGLNLRGAAGLVKDGVIGAVAQVAGEAGTRIIRGRVLGLAAGQTISSAAEFGIATVIGVLGQKFVGRQIARDLLVGGYAGVLRSVAKQSGIALVAEALSDEGPRLVRGARRPLSGYVQPRRPLAGYVGAGDNMVTDTTAQQLGYATA
jgi:hypothetical protein